MAEVLRAGGSDFSSSCPPHLLTHSLPASDQGGPWWEQGIQRDREEAMGVGERERKGRPTSKS